MGGPGNRSMAKRTWTCCTDPGTLSRAPRGDPETSTHGAKLLPQGPGRDSREDRRGNRRAGHGRQGEATGCTHRSGESGRRASITPWCCSAFYGLTIEARCRKRRREGISGTDGEARSRKSRTMENSFGSARRERSSSVAGYLSKTTRFSLSRHQLARPVHLLVIPTTHHFAGDRHRR